MRLNSLILAMGLVTLSSVAVASVPAQRYVVTLKIFEHERSRTTTILAEAERPATFRIRDTSESFEVTAFPTADGRVHISAGVLQWTSAGIIGSDRTTIVDSDGKTNALVLDKPDAHSGKPGEMRIEITVRQAPQG